MGRHHARHAHRWAASRAWSACLLTAVLAVVWTGAATAAPAHPGKLIWGDNLDRVQGAGLDGADVTTLYPGTTAHLISGMAVDGVANRLYWGTSNSGAGRIFAGSVDGESSAPATMLYDGVGSPIMGMAVDGAAGRLYWSVDGDPADDGGIFGGATGGESVAPPHQLYKLGMASGLALDPVNERLYWGTLDGRVMTGSIGGQAVEPAQTLYTDSGGASVTGVAVDPATGRLFWTLHKTPGEVVVGSVDGKTPSRVLYGNEPPPAGLAFDPTNDRLYWSAEGVPGEIRTGSAGGGTAETVVPSVVEPNFIAVQPATAPRAQLAPGTADFGTRAVGSGPAPTVDLTLRNGGTADLTVGAVGVGGANPEDFPLVSGSPSACSAGAVLGPGDACLVQVGFAPRDQGARSATVAVTSDGGDVSAALSGTGVASPLNPAPPIAPVTPPPQPPPPQPDVLPPPVAYRNVNAIPAGGTVRVRLPRSRRFIDLAQAQQLPEGTVVDARKGRITLVGAGAGPNAQLQQATFAQGQFRINLPGGPRRQGRASGSRQAPITELVLVGGKMRTCPAPRRRRKPRRRAGGRRAGPVALTAARRPSRRLWGRGRGRFRTRGGFGSGTVRGTQWVTIDSCAGTLFRVNEGVVAVRDFRRRRTVLVRRGQRYLARAPRWR